MKVLVVLVMLFGLAFGLVDINSANEKEFSSLNGIGTLKAKAIVAFRKGHCFKNINELSLVKGIGNQTVEKNKNSLTASKCK